MELKMNLMNDLFTQFEFLAVPRAMITGGSVASR